MIRFLSGRRRLLARAIACLVLPGACRTSPDPRTVAVADPQRGESVTLRLADSVLYHGELLELRDSAVVVLTGSRVAVARFADVRSIDFGSETQVRLDGFAPTSQLRDRLRAAARFPYGITGAAMTALLASTGQAAPVDIRDPGP